MEQNIHVSVPAHSSFMKAAIIIAIVIVMNLFFNYAISFVYNEPSYEDYFPVNRVVENITTQEKCLEVGGQWNANNYPVAIDGTTPAKKDAIAGYCDPNFTHQKEYDAARKIYDRNVFISLVVLGVIVFAIGSFVALPVLASAFVWSGVLSFVIASMRYWSSSDKIIKVLILAIALGALIYLAVKKFSK